LAFVGLGRVNYRITEVSGWVIVTPTGKAENNEPLRVKYLFRRWLSGKNARVIVNLKGLQQLGVWEMGLLTSLKREIDQRAGIIRLCHLDPALRGYFHDDRFAEQFEIFADLEGAMQAERKIGDD
jgi:anti-anti-sigma regulatory factor